jgi:hypothetical protein
MNRITSIWAIALFVSGAALAASRVEAGTYVSGNIASVTPNTSGTLVFSDEKVLYFKAGDASVPVPYASIKNAELGATRTHSTNEPAYKIWTLPKRFGNKPRTQYLTVDFKGEDGEDKTMTLEVAQPIANSVLTEIQESRLGKSRARNEWWGDQYWKTKRNEASAWKPVDGTATAQ